VEIVGVGVFGLAQWRKEGRRRLRNGNTCQTHSHV